MKKRDGFVSNSSSSSFIIGVAKVADIEKCRKYIADNNINDDVELATYRELKEKSSWDVTVKKGKKIEVESFDGDTVSVSAKDLKNNDYILTYCFIGNEGDYSFHSNPYDDDDYDLDYGIVYNDDFFDESEDNIIVMLSNPEDAGLVKDEVEWMIGASRNG